MLGLNYIKFDPTDFCLQYRGGTLVREGAGLAFYYFAPLTSLIKIPLASVDVPFIFQAVTSDYQELTVQGVLTYRISDPLKVSQLMNFTLNKGGDISLKIRKSFHNGSSTTSRF